MKIRFFVGIALLFIGATCKAQRYPVPIYTPPPFNYGYTFNQYYWYRDGEEYKMRKLAKQAALDSAKANIKLLKENTLVVRLKTGSTQVKALKRLIDSPDVEDKARQRYQAMLNKILKEVREENLLMMDAFKEHYLFSKFVFMPDTLSLKLKNGAKEGIFLNEKLEIDPSVSFQGHFFLAYYGESDYDDNSSIEGINIFDERFNPLKYPFPSFIGRAFIWRSLRAFLFQASDAEHFEKLVKRFNKAMEINN